MSNEIMENPKNLFFIAKHYQNIKYTKNISVKPTFGRIF